MTADLLPGTPLPTVLAALVERIDAVLASRVVCFQCFGDHTAAQRAGIVDEQLPPLNVANLIVDGKGVCHSHVRVGGGIILPGQV